MITVTEDTFDAKPLVVTEKMTEFGLRYDEGRPCTLWYESEESARSDLTFLFDGDAVLIRRTVYALEPEVVAA